jgi:Cu-processing system permease protein
MRALSAIAWVTLRELIKDKLLYNVVVVGALLVALSFLVSQMSFVKQERILIHLGLGSMQVTLAFLAILASSNLLPRELERRTLWVAVARPITRAHFVLGKLLGFWCFLGINWALLGTLLLSLLFGYRAADDAPLTQAFWIAVLLSFGQAWVLSTLATFFSTFSTAGMSSVFTTGLYIAGNNVTELKWLAEKIQVPLGKWILIGVSGVLPNLENFHLGTQAAYRLPVSWSYGLLALAGALAWTVTLTLGSVWITQRKQG